MNNKNIYNKYPCVTTTTNEPFDINEFTRNMQASKEALDEYRELVTKAQNDTDNKMADVFIKHGFIADVNEYKKIFKAEYNCFTGRCEIKIFDTIKEPQYKALYNTLLSLKA